VGYVGISTQTTGFPSASTGRHLLLFIIQTGKGKPVSGTEFEDLKKLRHLGICPNCGVLIVEGKSVIRGAGSFCSLECVAFYYQAEFSERVRRIAVALRN